MPADTPPADPFVVLRQPVPAVAPREAFTVELRRTITDALGRTTPADPMTTTLDLGRRRAMSNTDTDTTTGSDAGGAAPPVAAIFEMPSLVVNGGHAAVAFYQEVFGATIAMEAFVEPDGRIGHIELDIVDTPVVLGIGRRHGGSPHEGNGAGYWREIGVAS